MVRYLKVQTLIFIKLNFQEHSGFYGPPYTGGKATSPLIRIETGNTEAHHSINCELFKRTTRLSVTGPPGVVTYKCHLKPSWRSVTCLKSVTVALCYQVCDLACNQEPDISKPLQSTSRFRYLKWHGTYQSLLHNGFRFECKNLIILE